MIKYSVWKVVLLSMVSATLGAVWFVYDGYVPLYLQGGNAVLGESNVTGFGFSPAATGTIMTLDNVMVLLLGAFVGIWSDGLKSKLGRRLPFVLIPMPFMVLGLIAAGFIPGMIPAALNGNTGALTHLFVPFFISLMVVLTANVFMQTPATAMIYDWTPSEKRTTTSATAGVVSFLVALIILIVGAGLYEIFPPLPFLFAAGLLFVVTLLVWFFMKGTPEPATVDDENLSPRQIFASLRGLPRERLASLGFLIGSGFCVGMGLATLGTFLSSYAVSKLGMETGAAGGLMVIFLLVNAFLSFPSAAITNRIGRKRARLGGFAIMLAGCLLIVIAPSSTMMYVTLVVFSIGYTLCAIGDMPMYTDHMPSDKFMATVVSMQVFQFTISSIFGPVVGGSVVEAGGNDYSLIWILTLGLMFAGALLTLPIRFGEAHKEVEAPTVA